MWRSRDSMTVGWDGRMRATRALALALLPVWLGGCAADWVDADGNRHIVGFAAVTIPAKPVGPTVLGACARSGTVETLGALLYSNEGGTGLSLGYVEQSATVFEACGERTPPAGAKREGSDAVR